MDCFHHSDCHERAMILMDVGLNRPVCDHADWATGRLRGDRMKPFIFPGGTDYRSFADSDEKRVACGIMSPSAKPLPDGQTWAARDHSITNTVSKRISRNPG
jgi:hypothetical protein